jgi:GTPase SAR1 family protein
MTDNKLESNQVDKKRKKFFCKKAKIALILVLLGYCGLKYLEIESSSDSKAMVSKVKISEIEISDLSGEILEQTDADNILTDSDSLADISFEEVKEKGEEFVYRTLLKNQLRTNALQEQILSLKTDLQKYKNQEKLGKIIFAYVDLRQKIFAGDNYADALKSCEAISIFDKNLQQLFSTLSPLLKNFSTAEDLSKEFDDLIPELIATKDAGIEDDIMSQIRYNISKLIVVRRVDGRNPNDVDGIIAQVEKLLRQQNYQESLDLLLTLDQLHDITLFRFLNRVRAAIVVRKLDQEILSYLKTLS